MSDLLALSFDSDASPAITMKEITRQPGETDLPFGWGFGWYPGNELAAVVIKDPTSSGDDRMSQVLRDWQRFRAALFLCHLRGAAQRITQSDAQPFIRSYAGRHWVFAHSGQLAGDLETELPVPPDGTWEPLGRTDSERAFCWILAELQARKVRTLAELGGPELHGLLLRLSALGNANVLLCDGHDLAVYRDAQARKDLYWLRRLPPHEVTRLESDALVLDFDGPYDPARTALVFTTTALSNQPLVALEPGELVLARRAEIAWSSSGRTTESLGKALPVPPSPAPVAAPESRVLGVVHETIYRYDVAVERSSHRFRLRPVQDTRQHVLDYELHVSVDGLQRDYEDVFGNWTTTLEVSEPFHELVVRSRSRLRIDPEDPLHFRSPESRDTIPLVWMPWQRQMMASYLLPPELPENQLRELSAFAMSFVDRNDYDLLETLLDMNATIYRDFEYVSGSTTLSTTPFDVYGERRGVCQDFANLMICLARLLNVPARYRTGYIYTGGNYENKIQSDASHAWVELYLPWVGWHGLDPTNGCQVNLDHVRVACGRNYLDGTPTSGVLYRGGGLETLITNVEVTEEPTAQP